ncbi:MAG: hypothetical protein Q8J97_10235, partial [Flavobacteriaceae bacterium]|nr:hypothetical protein [Flavobacteriaceae bacterium]
MLSADASYSRCVLRDIFVALQVPGTTYSRLTLSELTWSRGGIIFVAATGETIRNFNLAVTDTIMTDMVDQTLTFHNGHGYENVAVEVSRLSVTTSAGISVLSFYGDYQRLGNVTMSLSSTSIDASNAAAFILPWFVAPFTARDVRLLALDCNLTATGGAVLGITRGRTYASSATVVTASGILINATNSNLTAVGTSYVVSAGYLIPMSGNGALQMSLNNSEFVAINSVITATASSSFAAALSAVMSGESSS